MKARGWKFGTIQEFFQIKDSIYQKEYQACEHQCDDPANGGWVGNVFAF
jgi:hypothetical protein